jgi:hypothetical protein
VPEPASSEAKKSGKLSGPEVQLGEESDALPPILLDDAREAAAKITRFITEKCDDFGADVEFMFDKKTAAVLNKIMIERFRSWAQSTLDAFLV